MSAILFGRGAKGRLVEDLQAGLVANGVPLEKVDGDFGGKTRDAVRLFQSRAGSEPTGAITHDQWTVLTGKPAPSLFDRCLQLTACFEGHSYTLAAGNFDGAWLTWGIIGFTMKHGEVQGIVLALERDFPHLITHAFGADAAELIRTMRANATQQRAWANDITVGHGIAEPWHSAFDRLGRFDEVQAIQNLRAQENYFLPAMRTAALLGISSEAGIALCFDIHVQNGGIKPAIMQSLTPLRPGEPEPPLLERIARAVAQSAKPEWRADVLSRKLTIATGSGKVHGKQYALANWGLSAQPLGVA
jgi:peptidoglycan hydrolase-like protein with peptidoglycan-binding domain